MYRRQQLLGREWLRQGWHVGGEPTGQWAGMLLVPDVQNGEVWQFAADVSNQLWPVQSRHPGVRDEKINISQAEREFIGRKAVVGLKDTVIGLPQGTHHELEQVWFFIGNDNVWPLVEEDPVRGCDCKPLDPATTAGRGRTGVESVLKIARIPAAGYAPTVPFSTVR